MGNKNRIEKKKKKNVKIWKIIITSIISLREKRKILNKHFFEGLPQVKSKIHKKKKENFLAQKLSK